MSVLIRSFSRILVGSLLCGLGATIGCGGQPVPGSLTMTWVLVSGGDANPDTAAPQACTNFDAATVRIQVTPGHDYDFTCSNYQAQTANFDAGYYDVQALVFGTTGRVLAAQEFPQIYVYGATKLGDVRFKVR